jgi:hypothetical protein
MFAHIAIVQFWGVKLQNKIGLQTQITRFFSKKIKKNFTPVLLRSVGPFHGPQ